MSLIRLGETLRMANIKIKDEGTYACATSNRFQSDYLIYTLTVKGMFKNYYYLRYRSLCFQVIFQNMKFIRNKLHYLTQIRII